MLKINQVHPIAIICSDKEKALDFYQKKLGFPLIRENYRPERDDWKIDLRLNDTEDLFFKIFGKSHDIVFKGF